jgi:hypothetical protein
MQLRTAPRSPTCRNRKRTHEQRTDPNGASARRARPEGDIDLGLAVVMAQDLSGDAAAVLAELIHKRLRRAIADAYDRGWSERGENR